MSAIRRWTLRSDPTGCGTHFWFYVYIYETADELQRAAKKYSPRDTEFWNGTLACFQPRFTVRYSKFGKPERCANTAFLGVMRFTIEEVNPGIVVHECGHAAVNYLRALRLKHTFVMGDNIATEEAYCFAVQEFSHALLKQFGYLK